jgi:CheY-like chemotaxis protein
MATPLRLLMLEDDPSDAELVLHELRRAGYDPVSNRVDTEQDYRDHLQPAPENILADFTMPEFDSLRALAIMQECHLDIPFIIVSGTLGEEHAVQVMQRGGTPRNAYASLCDRCARQRQDHMRRLTGSKPHRKGGPGRQTAQSGVTMSTRLHRCQPSRGVLPAMDHKVTNNFVGKVVNVYRDGELIGTLSLQNGRVVPSDPHSHLLRALIEDPIRPTRDSPVLTAEDDPVAFLHGLHKHYHSCSPITVGRFQ